MKELKLVVSESDSASLVLALASADVDSPSDGNSPADGNTLGNSSSPNNSTSPGNDDSLQEQAEDFFLPVTDQLRRLVLGSSTQALRDVSDASDASEATHPANPTASAEDTGSGSDKEHNSDTSVSHSAVSAAEGASPTDVGGSSATVTALSGSASFSSPDARAARESSRPRRTHLSIRPREIKDRIRQGASVAELAEEADTDESTIEPYAWPILQERALVAENAHSAYPFVDAEGGPSKQTLWEVLATALAARGESLNDCEWDAYQDASKRWFVTVSWNKAAAGQTASHVAEFSFDRHQMEPRVIEPHNSLAADLVDPRYGRPVRTISAVTPLISDTQADQDDEFDHAAHLDEPGPVPHPRGHFAEQDAETTQNLRAIRGGEDETGTSGTNESDSEPLLQNPPAEGKPKRRRKAVTPHWEDVLLGVRTNPKKK